MSSWSIERPTLLLNSKIAKQNITKMAEKAYRSRVHFRPHFKTHQSAAIGEWFREAGVKAITVSSLDMARYFAKQGWRDITLAFPVNWRQIAAINQLASEITLNLLVESLETVDFLRSHLTVSANIWIKVDVGYRRTGVAWDDFPQLDRIAKSISDTPHLQFAGLLTHSGQSYAASSVDAIHGVYHDTVERLNAARLALTSAGFLNLALSIGDTPTCSIIDDLSAVDEIHPGNFVLNDMTQVQLGVCQAEDIAVGVACPVVAKHSDRSMIITYGGAIHLSAASLMLNKTPLYGGIALLTAEGWSNLLPNCYVQEISQEHGNLKVDTSVMKQVQIGDVLVVLPVNSRLTVNQHQEYHSTLGERLPIGKF